MSQMKFPQTNPNGYAEQVWVTPPLPWYQKLPMVAGGSFLLFLIARSLFDDHASGVIFGIWSFIAFYMSKPLNSGLVLLTTGVLILIAMWFRIPAVVATIAMVTTMACIFAFVEAGERRRRKKASTR